MSVLVLGGAGYIGSHTVDRLVDQGQDVVVVDSLVTGHRAAVNDKAKFYQGDLADQDFMRKVFTENPEIDAVIHFAAYSSVYPPGCWESNIQGRVIIRLMIKADGSVGEAEIIRRVYPELDRKSVV